tara:strand:- start:20 stop:712 length:693 start_codon:yes stop_codon:yes gene_type:complete
MSKDTFSIIITNYNNSKFIDRAIRSIDNQQVSSNSALTIETIIVDDGSKDNPSLWLKKYVGLKNKKIIYLKKNRGVAYASNIGIKKSSGDIVMRVDADDFISPNLISLCNDILIYNKKISYVYTDLYQVDYYGNKIKYIKRDNFSNLLLYGAGCAIRKNAIEKVGYYNNEYKNCEDLDLIIRLKNHKYHGLYLPLPYYRYYKINKSLSQSSNRKKMIEYMESKWNLKLEK